MIIKGIIDEDFVNYKKPSMMIAFPHCTFKCEKECGETVCQNSKLAHSPNINTNAIDLIMRYLNNDITKAVVCQGLEPFDDFIDVLDLLKVLRQFNNDDFVIYTGYEEAEVRDKIKQLIQYSNVIVKFGRYIPNQQSHYDEVLGINLASNNQYAIQIS